MFGLVVVDENENNGRRVADSDSGWGAGGR